MAGIEQLSGILRFAKDKYSNLSPKTKKVIEYGSALLVTFGGLVGVWNLLPGPRNTLLSDRFNSCGNQNLFGDVKGREDEGGILYTRETTKGLIPDNNIRSLMSGPDGMFFGIGDQQKKGTLMRLGQSVLEICSVGPDGPYGFINAIGRNSRGELIAVADQDDYYKKSVFVYRNNQWEMYGTAEGIDYRGYFVADNLVSTWEGEFEYEVVNNQGQFAHRPEFGKNPYDHIHAVAVTENGTWVSYIHGGLYNIDTKEEIKAESHPELLKSNEGRTLAVSPDGKKLYAGFDAGLLVLDVKSGKWTKLNFPEGSQAERINGISFDYLRRPWIATHGGVLYQNKAGEWVTFATKPAFAVGFGLEGSAYEKTDIFIGRMEIVQNGQVQEVGGLWKGNIKRTLPQSAWMRRPSRSTEVNVPRNQKSFLERKLRRNKTRLSSRPLGSNRLSEQSS